MSFYGSLGAAVMAINAQATAIGHISDNVVNSTTNGYKQVDTHFSDLVTNKVLGASRVVDSTRNMGVSAAAKFANRGQGTIVRDDSLTSIAVNGNGFIPVSKPTGFEVETETDPATGLSVSIRQPIFDDETTFFTRLGDFTMDSSRRLVNSAGYYLRAVAVEEGETVALADVETDVLLIDTRDLAAVPTANVDYMVNLPASAIIGKDVNTGVTVIDAEGEQRSLQLNWTKTANNTWELNFNSPDGNPATLGPLTFTFVNGIPSTVTNADPTNITMASGTITEIEMTLNIDYGSGVQAIAIDMGTAGPFDSSAAAGLYQFYTADGEASNLNVTQDGLLAGEFQYISFQEDGRIIYNYSNGRSVARGLLVLGNFPEPDKLDRVDGNAFVQTRASGELVYGIPGDPDGSSGVGSLVASALEESTVDVAEQMTKLIVAQQAYSMNGQVITASDEMLSRAIDMKR